MRIALLSLLFGTALAFAAPVPAQALPSVGVAAVAGLETGAPVEQVRSRRTRVVKRYRKPYYAPYGCARPHQYYYWQFWPPVCTPL